MKKLVFVLPQLLLIVALLFAWNNTIQAQQVSSPNKNIVLNFALSADGTPTYKLNYKNREVIKTSKLGIETKDVASFVNGFEIIKSETNTVNENWTPVWGEEKTIKNNYNELLVTIAQKAVEGRYIRLRFRVFDDGLGFRYEFPSQKNLNYFIIKEEKTQFALAGDHKAWWLPGDYDTQEYHTTTSYLSEVRGKMKEAVTPNV